VSSLNNLLQGVPVAVLSRNGRDLSLTVTPRGPGEPLFQLSAGSYLFRRKNLSVPFSGCSKWGQQHFRSQHI
jgi:hypothetical protein